MGLVGGTRVGDNADQPSSVGIRDRDGRTKPGSLPQGVGEQSGQMMERHVAQDVGDRRRRARNCGGRADVDDNALPRRRRCGAAARIIFPAHRGSRVHAWSGDWSGWWPHSLIRS